MSRTQSATADSDAPCSPSRFTELPRELLRRGHLRAELDDLKLRYARDQKAGKSIRGTVAGVDARVLKQAGWAVVYAKDTPAEVKHQLEPLIAWRREQGIPVR